jgi:pyrimidine-nucleoside phosphorylase
MDGAEIVRDAIKSGDEPACRRLISAAESGALADEDLARLAAGLAGSGAVLPANPDAVDVASTGGPSSLSTLLCPLHLRARGLIVPKLGVAGRPAGGVDVLQQIPGFRASLEPGQAARALERSGYIHLVADGSWAPLDAKLFALRQRSGAQAIAPLVIASILAKKIAMGVVGAGLEVRIAKHGNFGEAYEAARRNAVRYSAVAEILGLKAVCALTDASRPYQPFIGRGESLVALAEILSGTAEGWLADHHSLCAKIADAAAARMGRDRAVSADHAALADAHAALLGAQGATEAGFERRVAEVRAAPRTIVRAERDGVLEYDLGRIRSLIVERQRAASRGSAPPPDPAGVILGPAGGTPVAAGNRLMSVRVPEGESTLEEALSECARVEVQARCPPAPDGTLEVI